MKFTPLHLIEQGAPDGPTLVFIPGLGGTTRYFERSLGSLPQAHRVLIVDPLGFGDSPKPRTRYTIERHIEALHEALAPHAPFTLVGHSMGTLLSVAYAARYPQEVNALALLSLPYYENKDKALDAVRGSSPLYRVFLGNLALAVIICVLTRRVFAWLIPYFQPDLPREVSADVVKHSWRSFTSSLWEVIYSYEVKRDVDQIGDRVPVLCVHGDQDPIAPLASVHTLAGGRPNWQVQVFPGVDHHPLFRAPEACLRAIEAVVPKDAQVGAMP